MNFLARLFLDWAVLAVSFFNAITLSWLGLMVLLIGNRRALGSWLTGGGLLLGALFFTSHTAILGRGLAQTGFGMNFWWWVSWVPAAIAPLAWYGAMLWHTGFTLRRYTPHRAWLLFVAFLAFAVLWLLVFANPLPNYQAVTDYSPESGRYLQAAPAILGVPLLILVYLGYSILCYLLPLDLLRGSGGGDDPFLAQARRLARPWLAGASLTMLIAALLLAWTASWALNTPLRPTLSNPQVEMTVLKFDLAVSGLVAIAVTLLGRSVVAYEVFTGRTLPRDRFTSQWRGTVMLAALFGMMAAALLALGINPVYGLMVSAAVWTVFYALVSWRSFTDRESLMARLRPFLAGQDLLEKIARPASPEDPAVRPLFETLCGDLLNARGALLMPAGRLAALAGPPLTYPPGMKFSAPPVDLWKERFNAGVHCLPVDGDLAWAVPLWSRQALAGVLFLGQKAGGGVYSEEEIELAQAGGERLLDRLAGTEVARLSLELLGQRLSEARVLEGQGRRVLHDEVLPELHTALLYLSGEDQNREAVEILANAHKRIADLLRSGYGVPERLSQVGLLGALRGLLENDFANEFTQVSWEVSPQGEARAASLPPFATETVYFAARELVRNAGKYARGGEVNRPLRLRVQVTSREDAAGDRLVLLIEDDGVGLNASTTGAGSGLRIHSALLTAAGGSLEISAAPAGGTRGVITL